MRKLIIIGSGPAGLTAGIYAGRAGLKPVIFSGETSGGQLINTTIVENWPGAEAGVMGPELMEKMREQAKKFGAEIVDKNAAKVDFSKTPFMVNDLEAEAVIIATGAEPIRLNVPGEKELFGRGVAVCAVCDAPFYRDKKAVVVGGGDAACEDALALTKFAKEIYLIVRRDQLRASKIMQDRVKKNPKIKIIWNTELKEIRGESRVEEVVLIVKPRIRGVKSIKEDQSLNGIRHSEIGKRVMKVDGVFLAIGHKPATEVFKGQIELDEKGYIKTGLADYPTMTSISGIFAAGDVVDFRYRQAVTAAGMGCQAAIDAEKWLESR